MSSVCCHCKRQFDFPNILNDNICVCDECRFGGKEKAVSYLLERRDAAMREFQRLDAMLFFEMKRRIAEGAKK